MVGDSRKKVKKKSRLASVVSPTSVTQGDANEALGLAKLRPDKTIAVSKDIFIGVSVETCFSIVASQLEAPARWDPIIVDVKPLSKSRRRKGTTSQVTLNICGKRIQSLAVISLYYAIFAIGWVSTEKPRFQENWRLKLHSNGTIVRLTLLKEIDSWAMRYLYRTIYRLRMRRDLLRTLTQFKTFAEGLN
jgi:hypothetical protein